VRHMPRPHNAEVTSIQRGYVANTQALSESDHRSIDGPQREIRILPDKFGHSGKIRGDGGHQIELACRQRFEESCLSGGTTPPSLKEVADLGQNGGGHREGPSMPPEEVPATLMILVIVVERRDERSGIEQ
jgi:hypothetical protein